MKYKALLLDFYGTLVAEDSPLISEIEQEIASCSPVCSDIEQIAVSWRFHDICSAAFGEQFKTQRDIELECLVSLLSSYRAERDANEMAARLFAYWQAPTVYEDAAWFIQQNALPVCIVSNIDTQDLLSASAHAGWDWHHVVTSESCRSYKPRPEMFQCGLDKLQCKAEEALHIGDSLASDITGAQRLGIDCAWVNRSGRKLPDSMAAPAFNVQDLRQLAAHLANEAAR